jgi:hypothetical protein
MTRIVKTSNYAEPSQYLHFLSKYLLDGVLVLGNRSTTTDILRQVKVYGLVKVRVKAVHCFCFGLVYAECEERVSYAMARIGYILMRRY